MQVTRGFDPPATAYGPGHRGVDLAATAGAAVRAAGAGVVSVAGSLAGRGVVVVVHGRLRTTYEPVTASVHVGDAVDAGQVIGHLAPGHPGCPVAACLHWGLRRGRDYLNPLDLVGGGPIRLLPLGASTARVPARSAASRESPHASLRRRPVVSGEPGGAGRSHGGSGSVALVLAESSAAIAGGSWLLRRRE